MTHSLFIIVMLWYCEGSKRCVSATAGPDAMSEVITSAATESDMRYRPAAGIMAADSNSRLGRARPCGCSRPVNRQRQPFRGYWPKQVPARSGSHNPVTFAM